MVLLIRLGNPMGIQNYRILLREPERVFGQVSLKRNPTQGRHFAELDIVPLQLIFLLDMRNHLGKIG
jgi:hypothetical protein